MFNLLLLANVYSLITYYYYSDFNLLYFHIEKKINIKDTNLGLQFLIFELFKDTR